MLSFADLETPLRPTLDPRVHLEVKDRAVTSEHVRQAEFVATMRKVARRCMVFAVPNGTNIPSVKGRAKVKAEGLLSGVPDLQVWWAGGVAHVEFKNGKDMPDPNQVERLNWFVERDVPCMVARTATGAMSWLRAIGAPVPTISIQSGSGGDCRRSGAVSPIGRQHRG